MKWKKCKNDNNLSLNCTIAENYKHVNISKKESFFAGILCWDNLGWPGHDQIYHKALWAKFVCLLIDYNKYVSLEHNTKRESVNHITLANMSYLGL